jgi:hypothetical protein
MSARRLLALARIAWVSPCSMLGAFLGALVYLLGGSVRREGRVIEVSLASASALHSIARSMPFSAITFGHVILGVNQEALARLRSHELVHVRQYERFGLLLFLLYPLSSVLALARGDCPYHGNHFEIEAYAQDQSTEDAAWHLPPDGI